MLKAKTKIIRVAGKLKEIVTVRDEKGKVIQKIINPLMIEFYPRDLMQVIVGSAILAVPVAFTEETWNLGQSLPLINVIGVFAISLMFISSFVYYNFYRNNIKGHIRQFIKRVGLIYFVSFFGFVLYIYVL